MFARQQLRTGLIPPSIRRAVASVVEQLESRRLLCYEHMPLPGPLVQVDPGVGPGPEAAQADLVWTNRGTPVSDTDGFNGVFGGNATLARNVVDAVLLGFENMIGDFNYSGGSNNYNVEISMLPAGAGNNFIGASATPLTAIGIKPKSGRVNIGRGTNGLGAGWWLDPTPNENSEFTGTIVNAFAGEADSGSPAFGVADFYSVVAAELTHCVGLSHLLSAWVAKTTNTGVVDTAEGGGTGTFYAYVGSTIKHLVTSNNGGPGGSSFPSAIHGAGPVNVFNGNPVSVPFNGDTYIGAEDHGNALFEDGRRYIPSNAWSLMLKETFAYSAVDPSQFATFYAVHNSTTGELLVRGGAGASNDVITISRSGNILSVSVDVGDDVPGTGSLPGAGNLPAFVTQFDLTQVSISAITVDAGDGNDTVNIDAVPAGATVSVLGGAGNDTFTVGGGNFAANILSPVDFSGSTGVDSLTMNDTADTGNDDYNIDGFSMSKPGSQLVTFISVLPGINANNFNNKIVLTGTGVASAATINAGDGDDTIEFDLDLSSGFSSAVTVNGQAGNDTMVVKRVTLPFTVTFTVTATTVNVPGLPTSTYGTVESLLLQSGAGNDSFNINSTSAATPVTVDAGGGVDTTNASETAAGGHIIVLPSAGGDVVNVNADGTGSAEVHFNGAVTTLATLNIGAGGLAMIESNGGRLLLVNSVFALNPAGKLDLRNNALAVDVPPAPEDEPFDTIAARVASAYAGGTWSGNGITTTLGTASNFAVGYARASALTTIPPIFGSVSADAVLARYTRYGDADLDGTVNSDDFNRLAINFGASGRSWSDGNFNFDALGEVNSDDFNLLATNFGLSLGDEVSSVGSLVVLPPRETVRRPGASARRGALAL